ncbi:hypothetical protein AB6A40_008114 [Gnathostoma spinigerum]|uniref:Galectin n=1 Tax=Gnathostoma spinigerum TaxID=75299 RepID=A0ABD6EYR5_9BILA
MELFMLISLIASPLLVSAAGNRTQCGCIDQKGCDERDPEKKLECPLSKFLCYSNPLTDDDPCLLDSAVRTASTKCNDGWSESSLKKARWGFPNQLAAIIQNDLTDGSVHYMYIDGYNGGNSARFIFKSNDSEGNVPIFMTMLLSEGYITINERKGGDWCWNNVRLHHSVSSTEWHMRFKVQMRDERQIFDLQYLNENYDTIYRYYPQTHVKRGDWLIFSEEEDYILGISWSRKKDVQFATSPLPGSRIVIHGKLTHDARFNIFIKSDKGADTMEISGDLGYDIGFGRYPGKNTISGYRHSVECWNKSFAPGKTVVIVFEVTEHGIKYYADGYRLCVFESKDFKRNDISQFDANGSLQILGYGANTCDFYRY